MKKIKNGFTLIEIIGIIILLGVIGLLVYPTIMRIIGDSKEDLYKKNVSEIERLAANWASLNESKLPTMDEMGYYIKIEVLKNEGFIEEDIINPKTEEPMLGCVGITYDKPKDKYTYKYYDDCSSFVKPTLSKFNASIAENEYGWRNKDFYVTLESEYLDYYDYCIGDNKCEPNIRMNNASEKILINQEGIKYVCAKGTNKVGITAIECMLYRLDKTKPNVGKIIFSGTTGLDNWFVSDVAVTTTKSTDNLSGIASNTLSPNVTKITVDTKGTTYTLTARDLAGNESSASYAVKVDKTKPIAGVLAINGTLGDNGWYKSNVSFTAANGSDATSGHNKTTINISSITSDTKGTKVIVTTMDNAGNKQTSEQIVKVDKTAPIPGTLVINGKKGFGEWYLSDVTFNVKNGSDSTSGHSNTTSTHTGVAGNTDGTEVMVTTKDVAGNTATRKYIIRIDKNEPTAGTLIINGTLGNNGWYISNVKLSASDVAGVTSTLNITEITSDTKGTEVTMTSTNNKTGAVKVTKHNVKVDKTKPTVGGLVIHGTKGNGDWYKSDLTFSVTNGGDNTSGHLNTSSNLTSLTTDTKGTTVTITTKDMAGNTSTKNYTVKMDKNAPKIEMVNPTNGNWTNKNIEITSNFSDNISGIVPSSLAWSDDNTNWHNYSNTSTTTFKDTWSGEGNRTGYNRVCDYAGNCSTTSTPIRIDKTNPIVGELVVASGTLGTNGWYTSNVVFSVKNGSDALSGHGSTTSSISSITTNTKGTNVVVTTKDKAGNSTAKTYTFKVDKNAPTITPKYSTVTIGSISEVNVSDLFIINYSISGGYVTCNVNKTKDIKAVNNPLRCTVKGGNGLIAEARINVKNQLASIAVTTPPNKTLYSVGSAFDKTGMVVTAYYKDGTSKVVTNYTIESSVTRYGSSHIGKVKKNWGINYLYPTRRDLDEYDDLIITYTEDGVTKTTTTPITVAIYANQVKNIVIASELASVNVSKVTNYYSNPGGTSHIKTSYEIPTDNEYYRYEVGSNYIRLHSLKAGYYSSDLIRVHFELYDGTIFRAGYFENIDSVNTDIKYSFTVARFIKNSPPYGQFLGATGYLFQQPLTTIVLGWQTFNNITDASGSAPIGASAQNGATYMEYKFSNFVMNGRNMNVVYTLDS